MAKVDEGSKIGRDGRGRWIPGHCPNRSGRGSKRRRVAKSLTEHLADAFGEPVLYINAAGKQEKVPASAAFARDLIRSLPEMTPRDRLAALRSLEKLGVSRELGSRAKIANPPLTTDQMRERVHAKLNALIASGAIKVRPPEQSEG